MPAHKRGTSLAGLTIRSPRTLSRSCGESRSRPNPPKIRNAAGTASLHANRARISLAWFAMIDKWPSSGKNVAVQPDDASASARLGDRNNPVLLTVPEQYSFVMHLLQCESPGAHTDLRFVTTSDASLPAMFCQRQGQARPCMPAFQYTPVRLRHPPRPAALLLLGFRST
jgi:hypothetical protein